VRSGEGRRLEEIGMWLVWELVGGWDEGSTRIFAYSLHLVKSVYFDFFKANYLNLIKIIMKSINMYNTK
jgi:hypothetical protein